MRLSQSRRHLPVDRADVVARAIVADFLEVEAAAAHAGCEPAGQQAMHRLAWQKTDLPPPELKGEQVIEADVDTVVAGCSVSHAPSRGRDQFGDLVDRLVGVDALRNGFIAEDQ